MRYAVILVWAFLLLAPTSTPAQGVPEARVQELVKAALAQVATPAPPVGTRAGTGAPVIDLTLDEALALALEQNLDIAVERLTPQTFDFSLASLRGAYRPVASSTLGYNSAAQLPTNQLVGGAKVIQEVSTYNFGFSQQVPWYGGNLSVTWNNRGQNSTSAFITFNPQVNTTFAAAYTQPLIRGFAIDSTRQQLLVTQINRQVSEVQVKGTIVNTLAEVRTAYFDLLYARGVVDVARRSLDLAENLVEDNKVRVEVGAMAPIDVVQSEAEAATRRQLLAQAEAQWESAQLALKRLMVGSTQDPRWQAVLNPTTVPDVSQRDVDIEDAVRKALNERTDLISARSQLQTNDITLRLLRNQRLPGADLVASYTLRGIGGTRLIREGGLGSPIVDTVPGGFGDAIRILRDHEYPDWNVQVTFSYPLGTSSADANYARAKVQVNQAQAQIRALELQAATEVTNAGLQIRSNWRRVEAARAARDLAQKRLEAEQSKFEVGMSTNFFVVQAQRDLADAEVTALRAALDYGRSIVEFERLQQTGSTRGTITTVSGGGGGGTTTTSSGTTRTQ